MVSRIEAILQTKMNITWSDLQNMTHEQFCREWAKYQWVSEQEAQSMKKLNSTK